MPIPAPKSLDEVFEILNECFNSGRKLWDMDRHRIRAQLQEALAVQPVPALVYSGMLATLEDDEQAMREYFRRARFYKDSLTYVNFNYGGSLMLFGCLDEAAEVFMECLENGVEVSKYLDKMAYAAIQIDNYDLSEKILVLADKLGVQSDNIRFLAMDMLLSTTDSPEEEAKILDTVLSDEKLKQGSRQYSEEEWNEMREFANKLKEYI